MAPPPTRRLSREELAARAAYVLRSNDLGTMTTAAPELYPHMWSWDAAFIAIGLTAVDVRRAMVELDTLLAAQWRNGMIPHIVFSPGVDTYFPGPERWETARLAAHAPRSPDSSGICQPPVHALALDRIVRSASLEDPALTSDFVSRSWPRLAAWHRWLAEARDPDEVGRVTIHHGWESGMDNSPRWDGPYSRVVVGDDLPPYRRKDLTMVADPAERPTDAEYDRYLWLVEEMRRVGYDDRLVRQTSSFAVEDVLITAILATACDVLADLGAEHDLPAGDVAEQRRLAARFRAGVADSVDPATGLARDRDLRTGEWLAGDTFAGFAPLLCGTGDLDRLLAVLDGPAWCGHPGLVAALPPSTSPASAAFRPREYWRGPVWPVAVWLFWWSLHRAGRHERADRMADDALSLLSHGELAEYYQPFTGEPLGSRDQSWTAAVALDWLRHRAYDAGRSA